MSTTSRSLGGALQRLKSLVPNPVVVWIATVLNAASRSATPGVASTASPVV
jgi:hypothetical protein